MPVPYTGYESKCLEAAINMVANSATFQTITGAVDATAALGFIVEVYGGNQKDANNVSDNPTPKLVTTNGSTLAHLTNPWAQVYPANFSVDDSQALRDEDRTGDIEIRVCLPHTDGDTPPERFRRWLNFMGGLRADIQALFGQPGYFAYGSIEFEPTPMPDQSVGVYKKHNIGQLFLTWRIS